MSKNFSFTQHAAGKQSAEQTVIILTYEVGKVLTCWAEAEYNGSNTGYASAILTEISDTISMLRYLCEQLNYNYDDIHASISTEKIRQWSDANQLEIRMAMWTANIAQSFHYTNVFGNELYHNKMAHCLANLRNLIWAWCIDYKQNYEALEDMGEEHYLERMAHIRQEGKDYRQVGIHPLDNRYYHDLQCGMIGLLPITVQRAREKKLQPCPYCSGVVKQNHKEVIND